MPPKNSGGSTKFPGGHEVIHRTAQTTFIRVVTPRSKQKETLETFTLVLHVSMKNSSFASTPMGLLMNITY